MFRDLSLHWKVTFTLVGAFALIVGVFLLILFPFQQNQLGHLYALHESVVSNLRRSFRDRILYDLYGEMDESLIVDLQRLLAQEPGVLFVRILDEQGEVYSTTEREIVEQAYALARDAGRLEEDRRIENVFGVPIRPVLLVRRETPTRIHGVGGRSFVVSGMRELQDLLVRGIEELGGSAGDERRGVRGVPALFSTDKLELEGRVYGVMQIAYSLAAMERIRVQTRWIFYGLIGSMFIIVLLLLNLLIARIVIAPLQSVFRAMREAGRGDLRQKLSVRSSDEIGKISSIFNQMVSKLRVSKEEIERYNLDLERMVSDRTEKLRRSRENITHLKNYLATVIENVGTGVFSIDRNGRITTFNERAGELVGIGAAGLEGRPADEVLGGGDIAPLAAVLSEADRSGRDSLSREVEIRRAGGKRTFSVNVSALVGEAGEDLGRVIVFDDVTQLIYSKKLMAWKEAVEKVIHEIKNPLTPIRLSTQQLRAAFEDGSPEFPRMFERGTRNILSSVENLQKLVSDFSHFYSLRPATLRPLRLNDLVEEVLSMYSGALPDGIRLARDLADDLPSLEADADHLKRVIANLVRNGIESMEDKEGEITVRTEFRKKDDVISLFVSDEGRGIGPEEMEKIFEPYFTTKIKGTGLGLIISKQIVEEHGGRISITSKAGRGATFRVDLPVS